MKQKIVEIARPKLNVIILFGRKKGRTKVDWDW